MINGAPGSVTQKAISLLLTEHADKLAQLSKSPQLHQAPSGVAFLRLAASKVSNPKDKGQITFGLGQALKAQSEAPATKADQAAKLSLEAEATFARVASQFTASDAALAKQAKDMVAELKKFGIGRNVPDIDGEDIDGKKFKLSDYKGKVVLLDFWGNW